MESENTGNVTSLLQRWREGDDDAQEEVIGVLYQELRGLARSYMKRERAGHTLQSTALVHEVFLRLVGQQGRFAGRTHFFRAAAQAMRRILVDHARRVRAGHRIPAGDKLPLDLVAEPAVLPRMDLLDLDRALSTLADLDPPLAEVVQLRCFVGLTIPEIARLQGVSESTVSREWKLAKGWLRRHLAGQDQTSPRPL